MNELQCRYCGTEMNAVPSTPTLEKCIRDNIGIEGRVEYCPECDQQYVIGEKGVMGTVTDIGMDKWMVFFADEGELIVGQEKRV